MVTPFLREPDDHAHRTQSLQLPDQMMGVLIPQDGLSLLLGVAPLPALYQLTHDLLG